MTELEKLQKITGEKDTELLSIILDDAREYVLSYTNRRKIPVFLEKTVRDLAVIALNRIGTEGESSRSEGGQSYSFDNAPRYIYDILNRYRLAKVGGHAFEKK